MKKTTLKLSVFTLAATLVFTYSCKKKDDNNNTTPGGTSYASMADFYKANGVKSEVHTINASSGGTFTTAKGTKVTIAPNALVDSMGNPVTGTVNVEFKDIYSKSDMLLSNMPTMMGNGAPLKSGGEFFISIIADGKGVVPAAGKPVVVQQPVDTAQGDSAMKGFVWGKGAGGGMGWNQVGQGNGEVAWSAGGYIFSLYQFSTPAGNGTWCNSDNPTYFNSYPNTTLTINPTVNPDDYQMDVYLIFKGIRSMVHVYKGTTTYPYAYAPVGLDCTVVAIGNKDGKLYASYTDITISANQTVNVGLTETTDTDFKAKLATLN